MERARWADVEGSTGVSWRGGFCPARSPLQGRTSAGHEAFGTANEAVSELKGLFEGFFCNAQGLKCIDPFTGEGFDFDFVSGCGLQGLLVLSSMETVWVFEAEAAVSRFRKALAGQMTPCCLHRQLGVYLIVRLCFTRQRSEILRSAGDCDTYRVCC